MYGKQFAINALNTLSLKLQRNSFLVSFAIYEEKVKHEEIDFISIEIFKDGEEPIIKEVFELDRENAYEKVIDLIYQIGFHLGAVAKAKIASEQPAE